MAQHSWTYSVSAVCTDNVKDNIPYMDTSLLTFGIHGNDVNAEADGRVVGQASSSVTIDLTNVNDTFLGTLNYSGKKVYACAFKNTGSGNVTVAPGGSDGYQFFPGGPSIVVPPGGIVFGYFGTNAPTIGTSSRNISITVVSGGVLQYLLLIGWSST